MFVSSRSRSMRDARRGREALADDAGVRVVLGEPLDVVLERVDAGGGEDARLPHRAAEHAAEAHERGDVLARGPASTDPAGAPRPFDIAIVTRSNGAASAAGASPRATAAFSSRAPSR